MVLVLLSIEELLVLYLSQATLCELKSWMGDRFQDSDSIIRPVAQSIFAVASVGAD